MIDTAIPTDNILRLDAGGDKGSVHFYTKNKQEYVVKFKNFDANDSSLVPGSVSNM